MISHLSVLQAWMIDFPGALSSCDTTKNPPESVLQLIHQRCYSQGCSPRPTCPETASMSFSKPRVNFFSLW
ncbi:hypothetical protein BGW80DRAFT_1334632 [Lactifluus volemus]|nr:hypothetical protein BGW80DRAFT_1334632 [Lactifluus volemus]